MQMQKNEFRNEAGLKLKGKWFIRLYGPDNELKAEKSGENVVCTNGKEFLASFLKSASTAATTFNMRYVAIGTDSTGELAAQTALGTEIKRVTGTGSYTSGGIYEVVATFGTGTATGAIVEYGLFNVPSAACGTMFSRDVEDVINKTGNDTLVVTTQITLS